MVVLLILVLLDVAPLGRQEESGKNGLTASEAGRCLTDKNIPMLWLAGHVADARALLLGILGQPFATTWGNLFGRGAVLQESAQYPSIEEIEQVLGEINRKLYATLEGLDDAQLAKPAEGIPNAKTVADQIALFAMHDSYHVGQMAYVRKELGYPAIQQSLANSVRFLSYPRF